MKDLSAVEVFLFDFGNVIINIDFQLMRNKFKTYLGSSFDETFEQLVKHDFFRKVESATYTADKMTQFINQFGADLTTEQVVEAWNALLLDLPVERLELLNKISRQFPIYMVSNTNLVHIDKIFGDLEKEYTYNPIRETFDKLYLSYEIGHIKPDREIYEYVLHDANLKSNECLFFDDLQENLDAAASLGIQTQLITKDYGIIDFFEEHSILDKAPSETSLI